MLGVDYLPTIPVVPLCQFLVAAGINETLLSRKQQSCQKYKNWQSHFDFPNLYFKKKSTWVSLLKRNNLLVKLSFS